MRAALTSRTDGSSSPSSVMASRDGAVDPSQEAPPFEPQVQGARASLWASEFTSPIGTVAVVVDAVGLVAVNLPDHLGAEGCGSRSAALDGVVAHETTPERSAPAVEAIARYFEGDGDAFRGLPLAPRGTAFQMAVWEACSRVPFGSTITYGELAAAVGRPGAARAVGGAMNRNPLAIVVPCHRVVGADGGLTGYAGGLDMKTWLLRHEGLLS